MARICTSCAFYSEDNEDCGCRTKKNDHVIYDTTITENEWNRIKRCFLKKVSYCTEPIPKVYPDHVSTVQALSDLKKQDPIAFELKLHELEMNKQLRTAQEEQEASKIHCPKCGKSEFTPVRKKFSLLTGFMTNKVELVCNNCGYRMKGR